MIMKEYNIHFEPAKVHFCLKTDSEQISEYFKIEYRNLLVQESGYIVMTVNEMVAEKGICYRCLSPNGTVYNSCDLSKTINLINHAIRNSYQINDWWPFHSGAVVDRKGKCVLLCGKSGSGKTTMGLYLQQSGWYCLTDDLVWFHKKEEVMQTMPLAFNVRDDIIRNSIIDQGGVLHWFPDTDGIRRWIYPNDHGKSFSKDIYPIAIFSLEYCDTKPSQIFRMSTCDALKTLLLNSYSSNNIALNTYMSATLTAKLPIYKILYSNCNYGLNVIRRALDEIKMTEE